MVSKKLYALLTVIVIASVSVGLLFGNMGPSTAIQAKQGIPYTDTVNVIVQSPDGTVKYNYTGHNMITTIGSQYVVTQMTTGSTSNLAKYMSLSTDASPTVSWTKLANEITTNNLDRSAALSPTVGTCTTANGLSYYYTVSNVWTATGSQAGIICMGLQWSATDNSDNNLFAVAAISSASVISGDTITGSWNVTVPVG